MVATLKRVLEYQKAAMTTIAARDNGTLNSVARYRAGLFAIHEDVLALLVRLPGGRSRSVCRAGFSASKQVARLGRHLKNKQADPSRGRPVHCLGY